MDTQIKLPESFSELLSTFCGKNIGLCCTKGKKVYFGVLKDVSKKSIAIDIKLENIVREKGVLL